MEIARENRLVRLQSRLLVWSEYKLLAYAAAIFCLLTLVEGALPQSQMILTGGHLFVGNSILKGLLLLIALVGCMLQPLIDLTDIPWKAWLLFLAFLLTEVLYLSGWIGMAPKDVLLSYYDYYLLILLGPGLVMFRNSLKETYLIRINVVTFLLCAAIGIAQFVTGKPLLPTESSDGAFIINSADFIGGGLRSFSLFSSGLAFGLYCSLCGALGIALMRKTPVRGALFTLLAAFCCYTTLTRLCYIIFPSACLYAFILTFGKKPTRGRGLPLLFLLGGLLTLLWAFLDLANTQQSSLENSSSTLMRLGQWAYYGNLLQHASLMNLSFGMGIVQIESILPHYPEIIDNTPLSIVLHIGFVGFAVICVLLFQMWLYLRRTAIKTQQPFLIAATSFWATFLCAGLFNIVFSIFGAVFVLALLCNSGKNAPPPIADRNPL